MRGMGTFEHLRALKIHFSYALNTPNFYVASSFFDWINKLDPNKRRGSGQCSESEVVLFQLPSRTRH